MKKDCQLKIEMWSLAGITAQFHPTKGNQDDAADTSRPGVQNKNVGSLHYCRPRTFTLLGVVCSSLHVISHSHCVYMIWLTHKEAVACQQQLPHKRPLFTTVSCVSTFVSTEPLHSGTFSSCVCGNRSRWAKTWSCPCLSCVFLCLNPTRPLVKCCYNPNWKRKGRKCKDLTLSSRNWNKSSHLRCSTQIYHDLDDWCQQHFCGLQELALLKRVLAIGLSCLWSWWHATTTTICPFVASDVFCISREKRTFN